MMFLISAARSTNKNNNCNNNTNNTNNRNVRTFVEKNVKIELNHQSNVQTEHRDDLKKKYGCWWNDSEWQEIFEEENEREEE